ncbi:heme exporter protein CcmB [uncultured Aquabacterium sp.]|uniref:heme exporter protein CcmB n=1 Tax=uncultured Aquabacterium sp. TaxID=158753 RepID=UPI00261D0C91|nr:heme exporter protein CcmB [uncultured Aquabacterium sp.]
MAQTVFVRSTRSRALNRSPFALALARGLSLAWRRRVDGVVALLFFLLVAWLLPLVLTPTADELPTLAPAIVWVAAVLAMLAGSLRLFQDDAANGALEQMLLAPGGPTLAVAGMLTAHWLTVALPLLAALPLIGVLYGLSLLQWQWLGASLLLGMPALCGVVALAAALSLGARGGLMLLTLLSVPLALPVMLFGVRAAQGDAAGGWAHGALMLLGATALTAFALGPWGVARALEVALE